MTSVEMGLASYGSDISKLCLEFLGHLATELYKNGPRDSEAHAVLAVFLKVREIAVLFWDGGGVLLLPTLETHLLPPRK